MAAPDEYLEIENLKIQSIASADIPDILKEHVEASNLIWSINESNFNVAYKAIDLFLDQNIISLKFVMKHIDIVAEFLPKQLLALSELCRLIKSKHNIDFGAISNYQLNLLLNSKSKKTQNKMISIYEENDIFYAISWDKLDQLSKHITEFPNNLTKKDKKQLSLIECAAKYGSANCFKYLLLNQVKYNQSICEYAVEGGNFEIIEILAGNGISFENLAEKAIKYHHNEIVDWIMTNYKTKVFSMPFCLYYMNFEAFLFCYQNGFDINECYTIKAHAIHYLVITFVFIIMIFIKY